MCIFICIVLQYKTLLKYNVICVPFLQAILLQESEIITPYVDVADNPYYHTERLHGSNVFIQTPTSMGFDSTTLMWSIF